MSTQTLELETNNQKPETINPPPLRPDLALLSDWEPKALEWLWQPYVPRGMITTLSGASGVGKTYIALAIAAEVTAGRTCPASDVLHFTSGDNPAHVLRPRFDALAGDAQRFHVVRGFLSGATWSPEITDLALLEDTIREKSPGLVILDPLQSFCGAPAESGKAGRSRTLRLLDHLSRLAEKYDCGMLLVRGLSRSRPDRAAELSPVRSELLAGCDADDSAQRALVHVRSGCGLPGPTLAYIIDTEGAFRWNGDSVLTPNAILMPEPGPAEGSALATAMEFLRVELGHHPVEGRFVCKEAKRVGISASTLKRAKARLRVLSRKRARDWYWLLPDPPATEK